LRKSAKLKVDALFGCRQRDPNIDHAVLVWIASLSLAMTAKKNRIPKSSFSSATKQRANVFSNQTAKTGGSTVLTLSLLIGILVTIVIGAILFWVIDRFCPEARLAQLLKLLVVLICLGSIITRVYPLIDSGPSATTTP
jgi:F0F1-type ATP synthase assembly protein I